MKSTVGVTLEPRHTSRHLSYGFVPYRAEADDYVSSNELMGKAYENEHIVSFWHEKFGPAAGSNPITYSEKGGFHNVSWGTGSGPCYNLYRGSTRNEPLLYMPSVEEPLLFSTAEHPISTREYPTLNTILLIGASGAGKSSLCNFLMNPFLNRGRQGPPHQQTTMYWPYRSSYQNQGGSTLHIPSAYTDSSKQYYDPRYILGLNTDGTLLSLTDSPGWSDGTSLLDYYGPGKIPELFGGEKGENITVDQIHMMNTVKGMQDNEVTEVRGLMMVVTAADLDVKNTSVWNKLFIQFNTYRHIMESSGCLNIVVTMTQTVSSVPANLYKQLQTFLDNLEIVLATMDINVRVYPFVINCQAETDEEWFDALIQSQRLISHLKLCSSSSSPSDVKIFKDKPLMDIHKVQSKDIIALAKENMQNVLMSAFRISNVFNGCSVKLIQQAQSLLGWKPDSDIHQSPGILDAIIQIVADVEVRVEDLKKKHEKLNALLEVKNADVMFIGVKSIDNKYYLVVHDLLRNEPVYPSHQDSDEERAELRPEQRIQIEIPYSDCECEFFNPQLRHLELFNSPIRVGNISFPSEDGQTFHIDIEKSTSWASEYSERAELAICGVCDSVGSVVEDCETFRNSDTPQSLDQLKDAMGGFLNLCQEYKSLGGKTGAKESILTKWDHTLPRAQQHSNRNGTLESLRNALTSLQSIDPSSVLQAVNEAAAAVKVLKGSTQGVSGKRLAEMTGHDCLSSLEGSFVDGFILTSFLPSYHMKEILEVKSDINKSLNVVKNNLLTDTHNRVKEIGDELLRMKTLSEKASYALYDRLDVTLYIAFIDVQKAFSVANVSTRAHVEDFEWNPQKRRDEVAKTFQELFGAMKGGMDEWREAPATFAVVMESGLKQLREKYMKQNKETKDVCLKLGCLLDPRFPPYTYIESRRRIDWTGITHLNNGVGEWLKDSNSSCEMMGVLDGGRNIPPIDETILKSALAARELYQAIPKVKALVKDILRPNLKELEIRLDETLATSLTMSQESNAELKKVVAECAVFPKIVPPPLKEEPYKKIKSAIESLSITYGV